jgi:hypothetical protein
MDLAFFFMSAQAEPWAFRGQIQQFYVRITRTATIMPVALPSKQARQARIGIGAFTYEDRQALGLTFMDVLH